MDIPTLLKSLNIPFRRNGESPHVSQGWIGLQCPWCGKHTRNFGLGISLDRGAAKCWKCGPHGLKEVLKEFTGKSWREVTDLLEGLDRFRRVDVPRSGRLELPKGVGPLLPAHEAYLRSREYDPNELVALWGIGGIGLASRLGWRIFIPVREEHEIVSWTTRSISDQGVRYLSADKSQEALPIKNVLYGAELARHAIIICEGPFDAWRIGPGGVATLGVGYSKAQVRIMSTFPIRVVCFDNDPGAQRRATELCDSLTPFPGDTYRVCLGGKDASSSPLKEVSELRRRFLD